MAYFVKFTRSDGTLVAINPDRVTYLAAGTDSSETFIDFGGQSSVIVKGAINDTLRKLEPSSV